MRKNCKQTVEAWRMRKKKKVADSIWTDGISIYSYGTVLVKKHDNKIFLNRTKYSVTTSVHQGALHAFLLLFCTRMGYELVVFDDIPIGYSSYEHMKLEETV